MKHLISIGMQNTSTIKFEKHSHPFWEITYYSDGTGANTTDGKTYPFDSGTIIFQPPFLEHEDRSQSGYKNLYFCVEEFYLPLTSPMVLHDTANRDFLYVLRQLYNEFHTRGDGHQNITDALLQVLYEYTRTLMDTHHTNVYVECLERDLIENLSNPQFSISAALQKIPMCADHFRRLFQAATGYSPQHYLQNIRLSYSMQLLRNSTLPIKNICVMCGYEDPYYFSRAFKKYCGCSPEHWRTNTGIFDKPSGLIETEV